ncbi:MAG: hypothetical protein A2Y40_00815 [Candidatus Margulisbacteria bacterium GWF2_35_9]|nr:MAG: hypothetical protein A2Y40_00815 [Candidatus Margulisbacteria bacterium GWF2_35_9]
MESKNSSQSSKSTESVMEVIDFRITKRDSKGNLQEQIFGINVYKVKEVIFKPTDIYKIPTNIPYLEGMVNLRGKVIPIINLEKKLGYNTDDVEADYLIVTEFNEISCGFIVNQIRKIRRFSWENVITPPDNIRSEYGDLITAMTLLKNGDIMLLLDFEKIVSDMNTNYPDVSLDLDKVEELDINKCNTVLCIDDSNVARSMAKTALETAGYTVLEAINGLDALNVLKDLLVKSQDNHASISSQLHSIVCDIEMPLMDGFTFTKKIKDSSDYSSIPVILHSSLSRNVIASKGEDIGAFDFITKFNANSLIEAVQRIK